MPRVTAMVMFAVLVPHGAVAALGSSQGTVTNFTVYGDGRVLVSGFNFSGASCSGNGALVIYGNHPHLSRLLGVIVAAKASGTPLTVVAKTDNCWYPEITIDSTTYVNANQ
jgi:hypothetical protein